MGTCTIHTAHSVFHLDTEIARTAKIQRRHVAIPHARFMTLIADAPKALRIPLDRTPIDADGECIIGGQLLADLCAHKLRAIGTTDLADGEAVRRLLRDLAILYRDA